MMVSKLPEMDMRQIIAWTIFLIAGLAIPFAVSEAFLYLLGLTMIFLILTISWDIIVGYTGQVNLGHTVFVGLGAYTAALLQVPSRFSGSVDFLANMSPVPVPVSILMGGIVAALFGLGIGIITLRLKGYYFSLVTAILPLVFMQSVYVFSNIFGGEEGFSIGLERSLSESPLLRYYFAFAVFMISFILIWLLVNSEIGLKFRAVRDDEVLAEALGINVVKYKILAFVTSSFFAGIGGATLVHYRITIGPDVYDIPLMLLIILSAVIGGLGTLYGPVFGGFAIYLLKNWWLKGAVQAFPAWLPVNDEVLLYILLIVVAVIAPEGLWSKIKRFTVKKEEALPE
ncbi:branched-chain amino acid ABC transporter permease [Geoglobus acetivorans]